MALRVKILAIPSTRNGHLLDNRVPNRCEIGTGRIPDYRSRLHTSKVVPYGEEGRHVSLCRAFVHGRFPPHQGRPPFGGLPKTLAITLRRAGLPVNMISS